MELKEKFKDCAIVDAVGMIDSDKCVEIAEDYAIGFAEWIDKNRYGKLANGKWICANNSEVATIETLLEIYNNSLNKQ